jgi:hypothetical protein
LGLAAACCILSCCICCWQLQHLLLLLVAAVSFLHLYLVGCQGWSWSTLLLPLLLLLRLLWLLLLWLLLCARSLLLPLLPFLPLFSLRRHLSHQLLEPKVAVLLLLAGFGLGSGTRSTGRHQGRLAGGDKACGWRPGPPLG